MRPAADPTRTAALTTYQQLDEDLLRRVVAGDEDAFADLYRQMQPRLLRYAASLVGDAADDVTAEAWLQIARDVRGFTGDLDGFRGWATRIVRNRAIDEARRRTRRPETLLAMEDLVDLGVTGPDDTAAGALEQLGTEAALGMICSLPPDQAEAVMLRAVVGLDSGAAGVVLGKSPTAVRVAAHRGLKRLARRLDDGG